MLGFHTAVTVFVLWFKWLIFVLFVCGLGLRLQGVADGLSPQVFEKWFFLQVSFYKGSGMVVDGPCASLTLMLSVPFVLSLSPVIL